jgi:hypothetical protein
LVFLQKIKYQNQLLKNNASQSSGDEFEELGKAMAMSITSKTTWAFYLELLMLGIPTDPGTYFLPSFHSTKLSTTSSSL